MARTSNIMSLSKQYKCLSFDTCGAENSVIAINRLLEKTWPVSSTGRPKSFSPMITSHRNELKLYFKIAEIKPDIESGARTLNLRIHEILKLMSNLDNFMDKKEEMVNNDYKIISSVDKNSQIIISSSVGFKYIDIRLWICNNNQLTPTRRGFRFKSSEIGHMINTMKSLKSFYEKYNDELRESIALSYEALAELCLDYEMNYCNNQLGWYDIWDSPTTIDHGRKFLQFVDSLPDDSFFDKYDKLLKSKKDDFKFGYKFYPVSVLEFMKNTSHIREFISYLYRSDILSSQESLGIVSNDNIPGQDE